MAANNFHELPNPHSSVSGVNTSDAGNQKPSRVAEKWRPAGTPVTEPKVSTLSRFAGRLIDRITGKAYSADELLNRDITAADITDPENIDILATQVTDPENIVTPALQSAISSPTGRALLTLPNIAAARVQLGIDSTLDAQSHDFSWQSFGFYNTDPGKQRTGYQERQSQASIDLTVTGGTLDIGTITQAASSVAGARSLLVEESGYAPVVVTATTNNVVETSALTLNSDPATVRITEGLTGTGGAGNADSIEIGTRVSALSAATLAKIHAPTLPTHRLVMVGDSITIGDNGNTANGNPLRDSALSLLRRCGVWKTTAIGRGWAGWKDWSTEPWKLVEQILFACDGTQKNVIWINLGTNDYGLNLQTPSAVQSQVSRVLKMIRKALPDAVIYVQTPLIRSTETANSLGYTLANYRTAITSGVTDSGVSATTVVGSTMLTTGDLEDGVHPSSTGHAKWAIAIEAAIAETVDPSKYTAGVFSSSNYFSTAAATGQANLGSGKSLILCWYQNGSSTGTRLLAGYWNGNFGAGSGWLIVADTSSNQIMFVQRPSGFTEIAATTATGWHCLALSYASSSSFYVSIDGSAPVLKTLGASYVSGSSSAKIAIGYDWFGSSGAAATEEISGMAVLDYALTNAELMAASKFGQLRGSLTLAQNAVSGARLIWTAENYNSASATQDSLGAFPVTITRNGVISRNTK